MTYFVYLVECADGSYYCGSAKDIKARINQHNNLNSGAKYTKARRPVKLIYSEEHLNKSEAMKREYEIKSLSRSAKIELVHSQNFAGQ